MKRILDLNEEEARKFFLKRESYSNIDLPFYFIFQNLLDKISKKLAGKKLSDFRSSTPREFENVNYKLLSNKDGKYAWRPFQLIHPAIYVSLVNCITEKDNWKIIKDRFKAFQNESKIECQSLPVISGTDTKTDKSAQILTWWQLVEQRSIVLSLDFKYVVHTDITDCYGTIYTHSLSWALHTKKVAKKRENRNENSLIGVAIDNHLQDMSYGQTNGIPQGSTLMDFVAEIVLGYVDLLLAERITKLKITDYKILRYRDDYRIFANDSYEVEQITKELSEILSEIGLRLNAEKTEASDDIIKSSIKPDKRYWISNRRVAENKQKWLIQIYLLSKKFPNSGTVDTQMKEFLKTLESSKKNDSNIDTLISLVTEIGLRNPRVVPTVIAIQSILISGIPIKSRLQVTNKIKSKFNQVPNSSLIMVWFQRLYIKINKSEEYEESLCKRVNNEAETIWNNKWLNKSLKDIIDKTEIVEHDKLKKTRSKLSKKEINKIITKKSYYE